MGRMTDIDRDDFALQMDYVARLGKLVAPWTLSFLEEAILFTGDDPFSAEELTGFSLRKSSVTRTTKRPRVCSSASSW